MTKLAKRKKHTTLVFYLGLITVKQIIDVKSEQFHKNNNQVAKSIRQRFTVGQNEIRRTVNKINSRMVIALGIVYIQCLVLSFPPFSYSVVKTQDL